MAVEVDKSCWFGRNTRTDNLLRTNRMISVMLLLRRVGYLNQTLMRLLAHSSQRVTLLRLSRGPSARFIVITRKRRILAPRSFAILLDDAGNEGPNLAACLQKRKRRLVLMPRASSFDFQGAVILRRRR